jgi:hypothetical protein
MLCGFYSLLTEILTTFFVQINCKSYRTNIGFMDLKAAYFSFFGRSSVTAKVACEARAVKGFRGINPQAFHALSHLFHAPLTAQPSSAFSCLTENHPNDYARLTIY